MKTRLRFGRNFAVAVWVIVAAVSGEPTWAQEKSLERLRQDVVRLDRSISETKKKLREVRDARFLPELYFALAEFLVEQSRYLYAIKVAQRGKTPLEDLDFTSEMRPKLEAIQVYETLAERFPALPDRDKALFLRAHELRELKRDEEMLAAYRQLIKEYPESRFVPESWLIVGDHLLEKVKDLTGAEQAFRSILARTEGPFTPLAQYRLGWVLINQRRFKESLLAFENAAQSGLRVDLESLPEIYRRTDIRREALVAMAWPYSEIVTADLKKLGGGRHEPLTYFRNLTSDKVSFERLLARLARRMSLKQRFTEATRLQFELLRLTEDLKTKLETLESLYANMKNSRQNWPVRGLVEIIASSIPEVENSSQLNEAERKKALFNLEIFARDIATREHRRAKQTRNIDDWNWAERDYQSYLAAFPKSRYRNALRLNLAESLFASGRPAAAALEYEYVARERKGRKGELEVWESALQSYALALRQQSQMSRLELTEVRYGLRESAERVLAARPNHPSAGDIRFNVAQSFYDERRWQDAVRSFRSFLSKHPGHEKSETAMNLLLDIFNQQEDYSGLVKQARELLKTPGLRGAFRAQVASIQQQAELKVVQNKAGDFTSPDYASNLLQLARKYRGTSLGDQALYEAFLAHKSQRDPKAYEVGEQLLLKHRASKYALEVATTLGQMAVASADYRRAALYFELFFERYPQHAEARNLLKSAAQMRELMADYKLAARDYRILGDEVQAARMEYLGRDWAALSQAAARVPGLIGSYWLGLALYQLRGLGPARNALERVTQSAPQNDEERGMLTHAQLLLAMNDLDAYNSLKMRAGAEQQVVAEKAERLQRLEAQVQTITASGHGRWILAGLYILGQAQKEFAQFILSAPIPGGLSVDQKKQYQTALRNQAMGYVQNAKKLFSQCVSLGEKNLILSRYILGCRNQGRLAVRPEEDEPRIIQAREGSPPQAQALRRRLFETPRDPKLLRSLAFVYAQAGDLALTELILQRILELEPKSAQVLADLGGLKLWQKDFGAAREWFDKALAIDPTNGLAVRGVAVMFKEHGYQTQLDSWRARYAKAGPAQGLLPPQVRKFSWP